MSEGTPSEPLPPGSLLLAAPSMLDPNFMHAVVLMCDHDEAGAYGLIVNRPTAIGLGQLLSDHPLADQLVLPVHEGGPVGRDRLQFLHCRAELAEDAIALAPGVFLGGAVEELIDGLVLDRFGEQDLRVVVGYAGWGAGQLEAELAEGSWLLAAGTPELVFEAPPREGAWRRALRTLGPAAGAAEHLPPDPSWN